MADLGSPLKIYESRIIANLAAFSGSDNIDFYVVSGARMVVTLLVTAIDPGATLSIDLQNGLDSANYLSVLTFTATAVGQQKSFTTDFNTLFRLLYSTTSGGATFKVGATVADNAGSVSIPGSLDVELVDDSGNRLVINPDGSLPVTAGSPTPQIEINTYNEITGVAAASLTTITTYTAPIGKVTYLQRIDASGDNVGTYEVYVNSTRVGRKRTYFTYYNTDFVYLGGDEPGMKLSVGDVITLKVLHNSIADGDFEARIQALVVG